MSSNGNQVPLAPSQRGPGTYPRAPTPHRAECYHPTGATGGAYMPNSAGGAQSSAQAALRVQPTPQPSAPPAPQQDMSKTTMAGHNYVSPQNQTPQTRPQYSNYQYRAAQHGTRPNTHPRQQQPYIPGATATPTAPVMYHPLMFQPHMVPQSYPQPRSTQGYFPFMGPSYMTYSTPASHTPSYYYASNSPLPTANLQANTPGARSNPTTLVGPQGSSATPTAPAASLPHPQVQTHMHQAMPGGIRPPPNKRSHRVPIIDPVTQQDILSDLYSNDGQYLSNDSSERQTPQPEPTPAAHSIVEEFNRMVSEAAKQPTASESAIASNYISKNVDTSLPATAGPVPTQSDAIISNNNNTTKSEILTVIENKSIGSDVAPELNETPVVSAISDSPVIVPKMPINIKQLQKNNDVQPLVLDNNKNVPPNKQHKHNKNKPVVPQVEELEKTRECVSSTVQQGSQQSVPAITPPAAVTNQPAPTPVPVSAFPQAPAPALIAGSHPQPQRIREPRDRTKSDDKDKDKNKEKDTQQKETSPAPNNSKGVGTPVVISPVNIIPEIVNSSSSQSSQVPSVESTKKQVATKQLSPTGENESPVFECKVEPVTKSEPTTLVPTVIPSATELLSASIEKVGKEKELPTVLVTISESKEASSAIQAQAKLNQSIASCLRSNQPESKMKDINLNNKTLDPDTANGNSDTTKIEITTEDINKNEKVVTNSKKSNKKSGNKTTTTEDNMRESDSYENGKDETDKVITAEDERAISTNDDAAKAASSEKSDAPPVFVPKYKYSEDQWSPLNQTGKRCYDIGLLKQIKDDPLSKNKPNVPLLESCNVMRSTPILENVSFSSISRSHPTESFLPPFAKTGLSTRTNVPRDVKKMPTNSKGSVKLLAPSNNSPHKSKIIHVSLSLREDIKLNETENAWKPSRYKKDSLSEEEQKTQELYKQFRGILNKLTPQKFDTLMEKVKALEINNQKRLEGVIDLVFEKAIDEPNFSEAYAAMCNKLSMLKVPADNPTTPDKCVNFRGLIISKCQNQFVTDKVDEQVLKIEKDIAECTDPLKKRELQLLLEEENRRVRMRSVGNVRFIGELYKLKMLTSKIMVYCMNYLIEKLEEEKLECLCKLLTTIGEQVESEVREQLDSVFKKMQEIVDRKSNKISSRVRFMIQDVIELRKRRWIIKSVVDSQPKMMDQIQKEADQQQRQIEIMNATSMGGFRRDEGGRGKRGDGRRQNPTTFMDNSNTWKTTGNNWKSVDTSKLSKGVMQKSLSNIKLAPQMSGWNHGSGTKIATAQTGNNSIISLTKTNKYSVLENVQTDPSSLRGSKDITPSYPKGASIERSTFNSRGDFSSGSGTQSGSMGVARSNSSSRSTSGAPQAPPAPVEAPVPPPAPVAQESLSQEKKLSVKSTIELSIINPDDNEMVAEVKHLFPPQYHAALVTEILNVALEKSPNQVGMIAKSLLHLVSTNTISPDNFVSGLNEIFEFAPDLYIDIPMLYEYLGKFVAPQIEKKHITFGQVLKLSGNIISENHGHLFLKAVINDLKDSMGPSFVKSKWQESGLQLKDWMKEDQVAKWIEDNKFEFLEGNAKTSEETKKILTPAETQSKLLQLMNSDENCECIRGWVQDNLGKASNEDWFMRALFQAICEHSLFGAEGRDVPHFNQDRMNKYYGLINDFGELRPAREASCLFGIQQLIHRLEHPQGLTLEIFQYLHEQYIISVDGFIAWEESEMEPEGKGVMMKALTSFFTNIKEADNEDSCSEE